MYSVLRTKSESEGWHENTNDREKKPVMYNAQCMEEEEREKRAKSGLGRNNRVTLGCTSKERRRTQPCMYIHERPRGSTPMGGHGFYSQITKRIQLCIGMSHFTRIGSGARNRAPCAIGSQTGARRHGMQNMLICCSSRVAIH